MRSLLIGFVLALLGIVAAQASVPAGNTANASTVAFAAPAQSGISVAMGDMGKGKGKMGGKHHHKRHHRHHKHNGKGK